MTGPDVRVVPTGTANLASVTAALARAGAAARPAATAKDVREAAFLVLPGVGALAAAMERLDDLGLVAPLRERALAGRPTLAVCLGMQLLFESSEESPGVAALGVLPGTVGAFVGDVRVPQMGWNRVAADPGCRFLTDGYAYFANSYRARGPVPGGWRAAHADHGGRFLAAAERGGVLACQFHPELSGAWGQQLLARWLQGAQVAWEVPSC